MPSLLGDPAIRRIYGVCLLLGHAYGLTLSVLSLFLRERGQSPEAIGSMAAAFALGIAVFSYPAGLLVTRVGGRAVLVAALLGYALVTGALPALGSYGAILASRFFDGAFSAGVWTSAESSLLARAEDRQKARATSLYAISLSIGYVVGPVLARSVASGLSPSWVFWGASGLACVGALLAISLPAAPASAAQPPSGRAIDEGATGRPRSAAALLRRIKTACVAVFAYGYFQSALVLFLPLYLSEERDLARDRIIVLPAFFAAGMLLLSNVVGRVGDRFGHQRTLWILTALGAGTIASFHHLERFPAMALAVFVAGATLGAVWPLALALQGVLVAPREYGRANGIANGFYAAGMVLGPPAASRVFHAFGGPWLFLHLSALWAVVSVVAIVMRRDDPAWHRGRELERGG